MEMLVMNLLHHRFLCLFCFRVYYTINLIFIDILRSINIDIIYITCTI